MIYSLDDLNQSIQIAIDQAKDQMKNLTNFSESEISLVHSQVKMTIKQKITETIERSFNSIDQSSANHALNTLVSKEDLLDSQIRIDKALANLQISKPVFKEELSIFHLTLMTSLSGLIIASSISPIFVYFLHFPPTFSNLLSMLIGMSLSLILGVRLTQDAYVRKMLGFFLGGAFIVESLFLMHSAVTFAAFRALIGTKLPQLSIFKRLALYAIGFLFLKLSQKQKNIDPDLYLSQMEMEIKKSLYQAYQENLDLFFSQYHTKQLLLNTQSQELETQRKQLSNSELLKYQKHYTQLASKLVQLHQSDLNQMPFVCSELLQTAKIQGISGISGQAQFELPIHQPIQTSPIQAPAVQTPEIQMPSIIVDEIKTFNWEAVLDFKYDRFGSIQVGDLVFIEKEATMLGDQILEKGLVRKMRKSK
jgi:hypothetical protein